MIAGVKGDEHAYAEVLHETARRLRGYFAGKLAVADDLEDVVQETLISIHKSRHTYDGKRALWPWVYAIANFRFKDYLRKHYRATVKDTVDYADVEEQLATPVTEDRDMNESLHKALETLPEKQRNIVILLKIEGYSAKEVAKKMDMSVSAVKVSAHRAYKLLRTAIEEQEA